MKRLLLLRFARIESDYPPRTETIMNWQWKHWTGYLAQEST